MWKWYLRQLFAPDTGAANGGNPPEKTPEQQLADEYTLDASVDPELDDIEGFEPTAPSNQGDGSVPAAAPTPAESPAPSTQQATSHPAYLVKLAQKHGVDDALLKSLSSEQLGEMIAWAEGKPPAPAETPKATEKKPEEKPAEEDEFTIDLDEEDFDPKLVETIKKLNDRSSKQIKSLQDRLEKYEAAARQQEQLTIKQQADAGFADAGIELLGKGGLEEIGSGIELDRRNAVIASLNKRPIEGKSIREAVKQRSQEMFGHTDRPATAPNDRVAAEQRRWKNGQLTQPTNRDMPRVKGDRAAMAVAAEHLANLPMDDDLENGFPD